jgi:hypothetical protein
MRVLDDMMSGTDAVDDVRRRLQIQERSLGCLRGRVEFASADLTGLDSTIEWRGPARDLHFLAIRQLRLELQLLTDQLDIARRNTAAAIFSLGRREP